MIGAAVLCTMLLSHPVASQQPQPPAKAAAPAQQEMVTVTMPRHELDRLAGVDAELIKLRERYEELQRKPPPALVGLGMNANLAALKGVLQQQAERFSQAITNTIFCSSVKGAVDDDFAIQIIGTVRDAKDAEKARALLEAESFHALLKGTRLVNVRIQPDGGQSGGCVIEITPGLSVTKQSPDDFATPMHTELAGLGSLGASVPDKSACSRIGQLMIQFRADASRVPVRKRQNFTAFWVRDGDDFTLCREDGSDWRVASKLLVKPSWEGILVLGKESSK